MNGVELPYTDAPEKPVRYGNRTEVTLTDGTKQTYGNYFELTGDEIATIAAQSLSQGTSIDSNVEDWLEAKYGDKYTKLSSSQKRATKGGLSLLAKKAWKDANNIPAGYSFCKLSDEFKAKVDNDTLTEINESYELEKNASSETAAKQPTQIPTEQNTSSGPDPDSPLPICLQPYNLEITKPPKTPTKYPEISAQKNNSTTKVEKPSGSFIRSALAAVGEAKMAEANARTNASVHLVESSKNWLHKAMSTVKNVLKSADAAYDAMNDKISDYLAPKIVEAQAVLSQFPEAVKELHDEATDALADAMYVAWDKGTTALKNWLHSGKPATPEMPDLEEEFVDIEQEFVDDARFGLIEAVGDANIDDPMWIDYFDGFYRDLTDEELRELYREAVDGYNLGIMDYYNPIIEKYEYEYSQIVTAPTGHYEETALTKKQQSVHQKEEITSDMNNAILKAIAKYLPPQYRNVESLYIIPHDILGDACNRLENDLKTGDEHQLSTTDKERILNIMWLSSGLGGYHNQLQTFMTSLNRFGGLNVTPSTEHVGLTFITRPRLCLQSSNIRNNRILTTLDTLNNSTMAFAIRCLLDSNFGEANEGLYRSIVSRSPIFDCQNPFLVPLCNALTSFNGSPDIDLESTTTDGGYMSEAQSFAIGGSNLQRGNYNLTLNFQEVAHNPVMAILYYWIEYIRCVTRGSLMAYADDIDAQRLNYTVSIYRFLLDPSHRYITKYAKYTGCYPTGLPIGSAFNFSPGDVEVNASKQLSITFTCNKVEYMDYAILMDFNTLMRRYCPIINKGIKKEIRTRQVPREEYVPVTKPNYAYNPVTGKYDRGFGYTTTYVRKVTYESQQYVHESDVEYVPSNDEGRINEGYSLKCPSLPIEALSNFRGLPYIVSDRNGFRLDFRQHPSPAFDNLTTTLADQLLYLDMITRLSKEMASYDTVTSLYTPDYYDKAEAYKTVDLGEFIRKAFNDKATSDRHSPIY